jgi:hypothetical protein
MRSNALGWPWSGIRGSTLLIEKWEGFQFYRDSISFDSTPIVVTDQRMVGHHRRRCCLTLVAEMFVDT